MSPFIRSQRKRLPFWCENVTLRLDGPELPQSAARLPSKERAQRHPIAVAYRRGDLLDRLLRRAQSEDRQLHSQILDVRQRGLPQHRADATLERTLARADVLRGFRQREPPQVTARPLFEPLHEGIGVRKVV